MASEVSIIMRAIDQASAVFKKIGASMGGLEKSTGGLRGAWTKLNAQVPALGSAMGALTNPITLVTAGIGAAGALVKSSVSDWVAYNKQIREMTQVTGIGAEEISRIVQAGDDWGISIEALRTSLAYMNKQGITPSINNLAKIADEYVAATDKSAWAEEAVKTLGRGYQTLIPLLAKGGDELRAMTDAVDDSLIATDKSIAAAREYEVQVDNLGDSWQGVKNTIGQAVVPVLVDLLGAVNDTTQAIKDNAEVVDEYNKLVDAGRITTEDAAEATGGFARTFKDAETNIEDMKDAIEEANAKLEAEATAAYEAGVKTTELYGATSEAERITAIFGDTLSGTSDVIDGETIPSVEDLRDTLNDANEMMKGYTESMIFNTVAAGLNEEQQMILAESMGLIDDKTRIAMAGVAGLTEKYDDNENGVVDAWEATSKYLAELVALKGVVDRMKDKTINVTVNIKTNGSMPSMPGKGEKPIFNAKGADYIIPPGYSNDTYPIGYGSSGERVVIIPKGQQQQVTNNFSMTVHTNAAVASVTRDYLMMQALAG